MGGPSNPTRPLHARRSIISFIGIGCDAGEGECVEAQWRTLFLVQEYVDRGSLQRLMLKQVSQYGWTWHGTRHMAKGMLLNPSRHLG